MADCCYQVDATGKDPAARKDVLNYLRSFCYIAVPVPARPGVFHAYMRSDEAPYLQSPLLDGCRIVRLIGR
ncbi:MAG: hypothetical protein LIO54_03450 [Oscillospiraceae bacterium]|nr:hypothetical protein [Oscillospiraceae bacterium]